MQGFFEPLQEDFERLRTNGVKVNYWVVCQRKLWLYARGLRMEALSERVSLGRLLHEQTYESSKWRELMLDNLIKIDLLHPGEKVLEIKYSRKLADAARLQVAYYLMYLKYRGAGDFIGEIRFPRERRKEEVQLSPEIETRVLEALRDIQRIEALPSPPQVVMSPLCKTCAYCELCWG